MPFQYKLKKNRSLNEQEGVNDDYKRQKTSDS